MKEVRKFFEKKEKKEKKTWKKIHITSHEMTLHDITKYDLTWTLHHMREGKSSGQNSNLLWDLHLHLLVTWFELVSTLFLTGIRKQELWQVIPVACEGDGRKNQQQNSV